MNNWKDYVKEYQSGNHTPMNRLIHSCEIGSGIDQHASDDLMDVACSMESMHAALEIFVMFLTNVNTITPENQIELVKYLRLAGLTEYADAVALGGFASAFYCLSLVEK